jgi:hypothetical protein
MRAAIQMAIFTSYGDLPTVPASASQVIVQDQEYRMITNRLSAT